ncbi:girdin isoform X5 [Macaca nemestrina]|uniref:Girdin isoform 2 n=5 Tax=Cercopithecinae TaxID=9528 RepID=H9EUB1_MACMU|nr:girdin isoform X5 [Macaca fascicularis]XP_011894838.1 PREDICTED: girdin isoform X4 [Cercocebus atys]XP_014967872.1 girdin isoform X5 [Macaca mulatta]XP_014967874.1 girdin isoform X5 [Macaca mulatta]XP_015289138.1 girdin isoform X5 [Macaca fascicularis]XP_025209441.1 girdin isoform X3 [Theropithecus gelada]XP_031511032.1 girdin isoform X7 [Papio anubis]XP_031511033.1 girdin isoform X7 [Papio anubis]XP_050610571.1 girdin isoform X5 [Macaca thibetana thibetana]XP_050610573.1 girdin isoform
MENEIFTPLLEQFMTSPLVTWVKTFGPLTAGNGTNLDEYVALVDGVFLNQVMLQINPKLESQRVNKKVNNDASLRMHNLSILVRQIKFYYQETLQQLIMMSLPNVLIIGKNPFSEQGTEEVKKLLLLLLGCAVQCQKKEEFIERIQGLDFDTKAAVAAHIQEVTHNQENVFDLQWMEVTDMSQEDIEPLLKNMALHLKRLIDERDEHSETIIELSEERDGLHSLPHASSSAQSPCGSPGMKRTESRQHLSVELADAKAKIRRLRQELEEKTEQLLDCKQELEQMEIELKRLQQENMNLLSDARSARMYRDELDALREKAIRVDKLESEVSRYKERLHDIEFYKARVEELKEDNQVLLETKTMLEDQLEGTRARSDKLHELEKENLQLKAKLHDMEMERDMDRKKIEELMEENMTLEMAQKQSMDESLHLGWELEQISRTSELSEAPQKSLGHEVNELTSSRLLKLEMENQSLTKTVEELRTTVDSVEGNASKILKIEKENQRLSKKVEILENEIVQEKQSLQNCQNLSKDLMKEKAQLEKTIETLRENSERQIKILEQENEHLNQTVSSLRQRSQISAEARVKDIEKENKILHESIKETSSKLSKIEFEKRQIKKELEHYKEKGERAEELENELHHLEKENELLQKKITNLKITCEKIEALEQENSELERENRKLKKTLDSFKNLTFQLESLEKENSQLDEENLELRRNVESLKCASMKMAQLQLENKELESEKEQLKKGLELLKASFKKTERLEVSYQGLDIENQRLQKALENSNKKIQQLESELQDLEMENQTLQKNLEELKISSKRLEQLEKENKSLEQETSQLEKDKKQLEKENKRLRQQAEIKDTTLEENNVKIGNLEKENKTLSKEIGVYKESCIRLKELEKENKELVKRATIDIKTLVTLREDLVSEKLKTQQMNNDLEKLTHELEKIGLNKERLLHDEQSTDDSRYKLLESKLESTLKKSLEIKEEKIAALEARLEESTNYNQQLRQELKTVKKNYEALKQRQDEERMVQSSPPISGEDNKWERESQETTRELLKVKDRLIEVERNNATLQAEKQALKTQLKQLETQNNNLQAQILALQRQTVSLQEQNTTLQTQNAKLQVENSTLNSQSTSLMNQNAQLLIQQSSLENENESVIKEREDLKSLYDSLIKDHEKLELLHERQASEYESLISKHGTLKSAHKNLEVEHRDLEDRYNQLLKQKGQLEDLEKMLKVEQEKMLLENKNHETVAAEYKKLCGENDRLNHTYSQLLKETEVLQTDHKNLKSLLNNSKLEQTRLEAEFSKLKEQYQQLDITSTKLNNQCELLSQLKGNLEEENRHLLDQIQTLMLQNRTLLEQNMESKDLFHVEQRQYIDKLNELRRQKEKLEEKIMDQYKFYDPSPPRRRGNWITLKMRKLIKSKKDINRERQKSLTLTPTRSDSSEGFLQLPHQDSQDSSSVGSNSLEDGQTLGTKKSSTMNDLVQSMVLAGQWTGSTENLEVPDDISTGKRRKELGAMAFSTTAINFSTVNSSAGFRSKQLVNNKDTTSFEDISPQGVSDDSSTGSRVHASRPASLDSGRTSTSNSNNNASLHEVKAGAVNNQSRPQSHSSGEFSLLHDHEAWSSSGSSPIQYLKRQTRSSPVLQHKISETLESRHHKIKTGSPGSEVVTLQQFLEESNKLTSIQIKSSSQENLLDEVMKSLSVSSDFLGKDKPVSCGLARSVSGKTPGDFYDRWTTKPEFLRPGPRKTEDTYFISSAGKPTPGTQGKIKLVKESSLSRQSKDSNPYATLPRASSVISTAEGTTRRTSIHDFLTKDSRLPISVDSSPAAADSNTTAASNVDKVQESRNSKSRSREQQSS